MPLPALVRTAAPIVVAAIVNFLARYNIEVDGTTQEALLYGVSGLVALVYYAVVSKLQDRWPIAGILLGSTARPTYEGRHRKAITSPATATSDSPEDQL